MLLELEDSDWSTPADHWLLPLRLLSVVHELEVIDTALGRSVAGLCEAEIKRLLSAIKE